MKKTPLEQWLQQARQNDVKKTEDVSHQKAMATTASLPITTSHDTSSTSNAKPSLQIEGLPANLSICSPTSEDIPKFKRLNGLLLPIPYPPSFYNEILADSVAQSLTLLAFWKSDRSDDTSATTRGLLIGAARCRLLSGTGNDKAMLYLSTLVLLSPYRGKGIASYMLNLLIRRGVNDHGVSQIGAHVWEANTEALEWYYKRGFKQTGHDPDYYRKLDPSGAIIVSRPLSTLDLADGWSDYNGD